MDDECWRIEEDQREESEEDKVRMKRRWLRWRKVWVVCWCEGIGLRSHLDLDKVASWRER